jgi:hypothetical protein
MSKRKMVRVATFALVLAGLAACVSEEERRARYEADCRNFGVQPGTPDFSACLQRESQPQRYYSAPPPPAWQGPGWWYYPPPSRASGGT